MRTNVLSNARVTLHVTGLAPGWHVRRRRLGKPKQRHTTLIDRHVGQISMIKPFVMMVMTNRSDEAGRLHSLKIRLKTTIRMKTKIRIAQNVKSL